MRISDELRVWIGVLVTMQVLLAFGAVELLSRMSPAIERILQENVNSILAVEDMLAALSSTGVPEEERRGRFLEALARAQANVTEEGEDAVLERIVATHAAALAGDEGARRQLVEHLRHLGELNRISMWRANEQAQRLGAGGAWAVVLLGSCTLVFSLLAAARIRRRLLAPVSELHEVLQAVEAGERYRRYTRGGHPAEFEQIGTAVNRLLEERWSRAVEIQRELAALDRAALLHLIDQRPEPVMVVDQRGAIDALNPVARSLFDEDQGQRLRQWATRLARSQPLAEEGVKAVELPGRGWLCFLQPAEVAHSGCGRP